METSEEQFSDAPAFSTSRKISAFCFTLGFFGIPLGIYSRASLFKQFCDFHVRVLSLNSKSPYRVITLSFLMSVVYTSVYCPLYYFGLMRILNVEGVAEIAKLSRDSVKITYKKYPAMQKIDEKLVYELDKRFGIENSRTEKFLMKNLGEEFLLENQVKNDGKENKEKENKEKENNEKF